LPADFVRTKSWLAAELLSAEKLLGKQSVADSPLGLPRASARYVGRQNANYLSEQLGSKIDG